MSRIEILEKSGLIHDLREYLGLDASDPSRDEEIANFDDVAIARIMVTSRAEREIINLEIAL